MVSSNMHTITWFQVLLSNTNNLPMAIWFQVFLSNTNNLHTNIFDPKNFARLSSEICTFWRRNIEITILKESLLLFGFSVGYLMPNPDYIYIYIYIWFVNISQQS